MPKRKRPPAYRPPRLAIAQILAWADEFHARTGKWPTIRSGLVPGSFDDTWFRVNAALSFGSRGLPGGTTLPKLLVEKRGVRCHFYLPRLTEEQILAWADEHFQRTGKWPHAKMGLIPGTNGEKWSNIDAVLDQGLRGFSGGSSVAQLLAERRNTRNRRALPRLTIKQILQWADRYQARTGKWPIYRSGPIEGAASGETWQTVNRALADGIRGLRGGSSLAQLLAKKRGKKNHLDLPALSTDQILAWADAYRKRHREWPNRYSGAIPKSRGLTWRIVDSCLMYGCRCLPGGSSLARLLNERRDRRHHHEQERLTLNQVHRWAKKHKKRTGKWPTKNSGGVLDAKGEDWQNLDYCLRHGRRGLPGGTSLRQFLNTPELPSNKPPNNLSLRKVMTWAKEYFEETGEWANARSGQVQQHRKLTWQDVEFALYFGSRKLPGLMNLQDIREELLKKQPILLKEPFAEEKILSWADAYFETNGEWPTTRSGAIEGTGETWAKVNQALVHGRRGLSGGSSLAKLLAKKRGKRNIKELPRLSVPQILLWADQHYRKTGTWPKPSSGEIPGTNGETWRCVQAALCASWRGLPGGMTLFRLLNGHRSERKRPAG